MGILSQIPNNLFLERLKLESTGIPQEVSKKRRDKRPISPPPPPRVVGGGSGGTGKKRKGKGKSEIDHEVYILKSVEISTIAKKQ